MAKAKITFTSGLQFVGEADSGHAVVMDGEEKSGGRNSGPRPMELLLLGLGGCTGMDVVSILRKKREPVIGLEVNVNGIMAEDYPHKYTEMEIGYVVKGKGVTEGGVKRAIELSMEKYCSVKATLEGAAKIGWSCRIVEE
ncbi:MAG: OsmC family protein [Nitrospiraceae bacterium]|nr:OsmC family protein [Nitrospiraceae bacterium]